MHRRDWHLEAKSATKEKAEPTQLAFSPAAGLQGSGLQLGRDDDSCFLSTQSLLWGIRMHRMRFVKGQFSQWTLRKSGWFRAAELGFWMTVMAFSIFSSGFTSFYMFWLNTSCRECWDCSLQNAEWEDWASLAFCVNIFPGIFSNKIHFPLSFCLIFQLELISLLLFPPSLPFFPSFLSFCN